jgi:hypothetical protein
MVFDESPSLLVDIGTNGEIVLGCAEWRWVVKEELPTLAFPRANTRIIAKLLEATER